MKSSSTFFHNTHAVSCQKLVVHPCVERLATHLTRCTFRSGALRREPQKILYTITSEALSGMHSAYAINFQRCNPPPTFPGCLQFHLSRRITRMPRSARAKRTVRTKRRWLGLTSSHSRTLDGAPVSLDPPPGHWTRTAPHIRGPFPKLTCSGRAGQSWSKKNVYMMLRSPKVVSPSLCRRTPAFTLFSCSTAPAFLFSRTRVRFLPRKVP